MGRLSVFVILALAIAVQSASVPQRSRRSPDDSSEGGWLDNIKEGYSKAKSEVSKAVDKVTSSDTYNHAKQGLTDAGEAIGKFGHDTGDKLSEIGHQTGDKLSEFGKGAKDKVVEFGHNTGEALSDLGHSISDKVSSGLSAAGDKLTDIKESDAVQGASKSIGKTVDNIKDKFDD